MSSDTKPADDELRSLSSEEFRDVIGHFASGVTVITAHHEDEPFGTTASAVSSLSMEPPMVLICLNRESTTGNAVAGSGRFAINILGEDQAEEAMTFAKSAKTASKFDGVDVTTGSTGQPLLADSLATIECKVTEQVEGGTHWVFLAEVEAAQARPGSPLAYFKGSFGRLQTEQDTSALDDLRARILSRELAVGEPLALDEIAEQFDLLRGSVYHALTQLTGEGLVSKDDTGRFVITPLTEEAVNDGWRARCVIELGVAAQSVGKVDADRLTKLRKLAAAAEPGPAESFRMDEWLPLYGAFHEGLVALADSQPLSDAYRRINAPAMILSVTQQQMAEQGAEREQAQTAYEHILAVAEALESSDLPAASQAIREHDAFARRVAERFMGEQGGTI